ncbi:MAG: response regulator transcription factor [Flavobacteriales bacterium]|nr:response regulator transcription factor [Flavobacteriales bacterium]
MKNILLVEDDDNLGFVIQDNLKLNGYKVYLCKDGEIGLKTFNEKSIDICLLDVMLPKQDGFSLAKDIRKMNNSVPIIFLTAKAMIEDKTIGFEVGADDYLTKPFNMEELLLRINAVLKRTETIKSPSANGFQLGNLFFDDLNYQLIGLETKKLTKKEAEILKLLCIEKNKVIEREIILKKIWGDDSYFNGRSLDVFITKLRKYLQDEESVSIENIHGIGFSLKE